MAVELTCGIVSTVFYLEFLMGIVDTVPGHSIRVFSLYYSLALEARFPTQLQQIAEVYRYLLTQTSQRMLLWQEIPQVPPSSISSSTRNISPRVPAYDQLQS